MCMYEFGVSTHTASSYTRTSGTDALGRGRGLPGTLPSPTDGMGFETRGFTTRGFVTRTFPGFATRASFLVRRSTSRAPATPRLAFAPSRPAAPAPGP